MKKAETQGMLRKIPRPFAGQESKPHGMVYQSPCSAEVMKVVGLVTVAVCQISYNPNNPKSS